MIVPDRSDESLFAATEYDTVPFPLPELPLVTTTQLASDVAVHEQPVSVVTANDPAPPADSTLAISGLSE
jgi:hypothetical protein